jgi:hypothetical protein
MSSFFQNVSQIKERKVSTCKVPKNRFSRKGEREHILQVFDQLVIPQKKIQTIFLFYKTFVLFCPKIVLSTCCSFGGLITQFVLGCLSHCFIQLLLFWGSYHTVSTVVLGGLSHCFVQLLLFWGSYHTVSTVPYPIQGSEVIVTPEKL